MEKTLYYKGSFPYRRLSASIPSLPEGFKSAFSRHLSGLITYNVLIEDAAEAEEFLEAAEAGEEFFEAAEAFAV